MFTEKVKGDPSLQEGLKASKSQNEVVSIAKEHGHEFEAEHVSQISEKALDGLAGGGGTTPKYNEGCGETHGFGIFCKG